jgi:hypothetical protein
MMSESNTPIEQIRAVLERFQGYYTRREAGLLDEFMELLAKDDLEVIGTNAVRPGQDEWYLDREAARQIFLGDWQSWGDVRLDVAGARIRANGETGWLSTSGTVQMRIPAEQNYADFLAFVGKYMQRTDLSAEQKLLYILRGGTNTVYELRRGEVFTWPLRFTAVLRREAESWQFVQMQFSFATTHFPDVREE